MIDAVVEAKKRYGMRSKRVPNLSTRRLRAWRWWTSRLAGPQRESMEVPELTKELIDQSRVIAKGRGIRDLKRLIAKYGGKPSMWTKKSSPPLEVDGELYEYHWYEHHGIGRLEIKMKKVRDL